MAAYPLPLGSAPAGIAVDPSSRFAFVAVYGYTDIGAYTIDGNTGALTAVAGSPFTVPRPGATMSGAVLPTAVTVDPGGQFLYVAGAGGSGNLATYTGTVSGDTMSGTYVVGGSQNGSWSAHRTS